MIRVWLRFLSLCLILVGVIGCVPPTPPPSPTPWPTATPLALETTAPASPMPLPATSTPAPTPTPTPTPSLTTISIWENLPEAQRSALAQEIEAFQAEFPQYQIEQHHYDTPENFVPSLLTDDIEFEVVLAAPPLLNDLWEADQLAPMSDFFPPSFLDAFAAITLVGSSRAGRSWGLPDAAGFHLLLFYNKALLDSPPADMAGLTGPVALTDSAERLDQDTDRLLGLNSYDPIWLLPWLTAFGALTFDETNRPRLDISAAEATLALYLDWHDQTDGIAAIRTYNEMRADFLEEKIAVMIDGEWSIRDLAGTDAPDWGLARLPTLDPLLEEGQPPAPLILGRYWAVNRQVITGDQALAVTAWLEYISRPERQLDWTTQFGLLPTRREALDAPLIVNDPILRVSAAQMEAGQAAPLGVNVNLFLDALRGPLRDALDGELTPQEAAQAMAENLGQ